MKRDRNFYYVLVMFLFVTCFTTCYILSNRLIQFGGLMATASAIVYPFTYFVAVLFYERYGKNQTFELVDFAVFSLVFMGIIFAFASSFDVYNEVDGLEKIFNTDFRVLMSSVVAFIVGVYVLIRLYDFLGNKNGFDFLISGVIAITVDSFLFIFLGYLGTISFKEVLNLATGQYALNVVAVIIYALCFNSIITTLIKTRNVEEEREKEKLELEKAKLVKKETPKETVKAAPKKTTKTKTTKTTTKSNSTKKKTTKTASKKTDKKALHD